MWISHCDPTDLVAEPQADLARENERMHLENRILKEKRGIPKKLRSSSRDNRLGLGRTFVAHRPIGHNAPIIEHTCRI
jgi:hypothetical protein